MNIRHLFFIFDKKKNVWENDAIVLFSTHTHQRYNGNQNGEKTKQYLGWVPIDTLERGDKGTFSAFAATDNHPVRTWNRIPDFLCDKTRI